MRTGWLASAPCQIVLYEGMPRLLKIIAQTLSCGYVHGLGVCVAIDNFALYQSVFGATTYCKRSEVHEEENPK